MEAKGTIKWERCIKILLWLTVLLYWVSGVVLIITGVSVQVKLRDTFVVLTEAASGIPVIVTVIGVLIILLSGFGAIALLRSNTKMIKLFTGLLLVLLITEIIVGATAYAYREKLYQTSSKDFVKILNKYSGELRITKGVDMLQTEFQCCGAENYTDWLNTTFGLLSSSVPRSCCKVPVESCVTDLSKYIVGINQQGCFLKLKNWIERHISAFGGVGVLLVFGQLTGILLCYILLKILKENYASID
ncbi:tetraspanin-6-like [Liasis olivaceus]